MTKAKKIERVSTKEVLERAAERWPQAQRMFVRQCELHVREGGKFRMSRSYELRVYTEMAGEELFHVFTGSLETMLKKIEAAK